MLQVLSAKVERWKGRRKRTKDGGRSSKGKMRVKERDKVRLKTMSACFLGWKGRRRKDVKWRKRERKEEERGGRSLFMQALSKVGEKGG